MSLHLPLPVLISTYSYAPPNPDSWGSSAARLGIYLYLFITLPRSVPISKQDSRESQMVFSPEHLSTTGPSGPKFPGARACLSLH